MFAYGKTVRGVAFVLAGLVPCAEAAERRVMDLSGAGWMLTESDGASYPVTVPHSWNIEDGCDGRGVLSSERYAKNSSCMNSYERKRVTYARTLPDPKPGRRYFVRCEGASITAAVFVNGVKAGDHLGAFTAFCFEVTDLLKPSGNMLEVAVDNFSRDDVAPPVNADFTMYGGLCRGVSLIETPSVCIDPVTDGASGVRLFPDPKTGRVRAEIRVSGAPDETREFAVRDFRLWSPETPVVYTQRFEIASGDAVTETFGFRTVEFRDDGFYLNGRRRFIRGVNYHQDREGCGWAVTRGQIAADVDEMKELGADGVRTAHYPHQAHAYAQFDEKGLVAWCEQPNVNGLRFTESFRSNCWRQTREMVMQLFNHPSIVTWSIFNELYNKVPMTEGEPEAMMEELRDYVKSLDPTRPVSAAGSFPEKRRLNAVPDVLGFNRYPGWYGPAEMPALIDEICRVNGRKGFLMTEYGAGASVNQHGDAASVCEPDSSWHTEEYQAMVHADDYRAIVSDPRVWGSFVWCMFDYGSDRRLEGEIWGRNDKGLVAFDHKMRKDAWYLYRANWRAEPKLHLVGSRGLQGTTNETLTVLGFSNASEVELRVNGQCVGRKCPDAARCVRWNLTPLSLGTNVVTLSAGGLVATGTWVRVKGCNFDKDKIGDVRLEDPLTFADGRRVETHDDWLKRRFEILELFQSEMYGRLPAKVRPVVDVVDEGVTLGGYATRKLFRMYFRSDRTGPCVNWMLLAPRHAKGPSPALMFLNYGGNHELFDDSVTPVPTSRMRDGSRAQEATRGRYADPNGRTVYPVGMMIAHGFAVMTACYCDVSPDPHGRVLDGNYRTDDVLSLFPYDASRTDNTTALGAWAWALMRGLDLLEGEKAVDARRVTVCGTSRLGKAALIAGAFDDRFFAVVPNQTGGGGSPLLKRNYGENVSSLLLNFPHWFCRAFGRYADNEKAMPFDSHLLMACVAPRKLLVEGFDDPFYDTEGEFLALKAASPVWPFLGASPLPDVQFPEPYSTAAVGLDVGYVRRTERHGLSAHDWTWVMDFVQDSTGLETERWQGEVDRAAAAGGGIVRIPAGRHLLGQLDLRSNVELRLEKGAVLEGAVGLEHYRVTTLPYSEGTWSAIVSAIGVTNVAVTGGGEIYGNGTAWPQPENMGGNQEGRRPRGLLFADSKDVRLQGFALRDAACWGIVFKRCDGVDVRDVTVDNHANFNNDGIDIEARNVVIADCDVDSGDDGVCIKSNDPSFLVENILVTNVVARSHCNALKLGTASHGTMRNIRFVSCRTEAPRRDFVDRRFGRNRPANDNADRIGRMPGACVEESSGKAAIAIENVDGGTVEDIIYRDIQLCGVRTPIFIRAGLRYGRPCGTPPSNSRVFQNILVEDVTGEAASGVASSVTGVDGCRISGVTLRNVRLVCRGLGEDSSRWRTLQVPEKPEAYPDADMFRHALPAYGLYVRHVDGLTLDNVVFALRQDETDVRNPVVCEDCTE